MGSTRPLKIATAVAVLIVASIAVTVAFGASSKSAQVNVRATSLGKVIVDSNGHTLYLYAPDKMGKSSCYGECATFWPPLMKTSATLAGPGVKASLITTTKRKNGKLQLVYNGHPLYRFAKDKKSGQANGQGLNAAGGLWWVLAPVGQADREEDVRRRRRPRRPRRRRRRRAAEAVRLRRLGARQVPGTERCLAPAASLAAANVAERGRSERDRREPCVTAVAERRLGLEPDSCASVVSRRKWRTSSQRSPSCEAWNAYAGPIRAIRSQVVGAGSGHELQSSETSRVTTETIVGTPAGDRSSASFAHVRSSTQTTSAPASNVSARSASTRAERMKSPSTAKSSAGADAVDRAGAGIDEPVGTRPGGDEDGVGRGQSTLVQLRRASPRATVRAGGERRPRARRR